MLGWSVRGMLLTGKMRKAIVDKDAALTELDQARDEIERLFAAQRAQRGEGGGVADASARKISDLTAELQLGAADWVLCLEVAEHIPRAFEERLLANLDSHNRRGIVMSWSA